MLQSRCLLLDRTGSSGRSSAHVCVRCQNVPNISTRLVEVFSRHSTRSRESASEGALPLEANMLIVILIVLLLLVGGGGYYMGPGVGYYGGGGLSIILAIVILYLLFGRSRSRL